MPMSPRLLRPRAAASTAFDPRAISGLGLWLDFSDLSTLAQNSDGTTAATATNDPIGYVADKSGNGRHFTQSTNNARPLLALANQNGRPAAVFDGSNDSLLGNAACLNLARNVGGFSAFCVRRPDATGIQTAFFNLSVNTSALARFVLSLNGSARRTVLVRRLDANSSTFIADGLVDSTDPHIYYGQCDYANGGNDAIRLVVNGQQLATASLAGTGNTSDTDSSSVVVGAGGGGTSNFFDGSIAEVIAYPRVLADAERQAIERYLSAKWGVALA